jgi:hypothetical protein
MIFYFRALLTTMLENFRGLRKFLDDHRYASDFIEKVRSHHEGREREEHEVDGQEDYLLGGFQTRLNHTFVSFVPFVVNPSFHLVAALPRWALRSSVVRSKFVCLRRRGMNEHD